MIYSIKNLTFLLVGGIAVSLLSPVSAEPSLPEELSGPQVVRLLMMSDEELDRLEAAIHYVRDLSAEEKASLREQVREYRQEFRSRGGEGREGGETRRSVDRGELREEWQAFREALEEAGVDPEDLPRERRRQMFRRFHQADEEGRAAMGERWRQARERMDGGEERKDRESRGNRERRRDRNAD